MRQRASWPRGRQQHAQEPLSHRADGARLVVPAHGEDVAGLGQPSQLFETPVLEPQLAAEVEFPYIEPSAFEDIESGDQLPIVPDAFAEQYRALIKAHVDELSSRATAQRMDYMLLKTSMPLDHALFQYLSIRDRLTRTR